MQCKDISTEDILRFLAGRQGSWTMLWDIPFPVEAGPKLRLAKMRMIHRAGLVGGCPCGCRGDFEITDKGLARIGQPRTAVYTGY